jgi:hypothetical protein
MAEIPQNAKFLLFGMGPRRHAQIAFIVNFIGLATVILGIISAAIDNPLGLGASNWFLLTIIFFIWGISDWLIAYFGAKEGYTK